MNKFGMGYKNAVGEIIGGIMTPLIIDAFASTGLLPQYFFILVFLINVIGTFVLIFSMESWGFLYAFGWLFGSFIFLKSGLLEPLDFILYIFLPIIFLGLRAYYWIKIASE